MGGIRKKKSFFFEIPFGTRYGELKLLTTAKRKSFALLKGHSESIWQAFKHGQEIHSKCFLRANLIYDKQPFIIFFVFFPISGPGKYELLVLYNILLFLYLYRLLLFMFGEYVSYLAYIIFIWFGGGPMEIMRWTLLKILRFSLHFVRFMSSTVRS